MKQIDYVLHDGWLTKYEKLENNSLRIFVDLDEVHNKNCKETILTFEDVFNIESFIKFLDSIDDEERIDDFRFAENEESKEGDYYLILEMDEAGKFRIHCRDFMFFTSECKIEHNHK